MENDELVGRFNVCVAKSIKEECNSKNKVKLSDLSISQSALITIGQSIRQVALEMGIDEYEVKKHMNSSVYEIKGDLVFIFEIPSIDADCIVSIPWGYWKYKWEEEDKIIQ
jgi:hypothetical protein